MAAPQLYIRQLYEKEIPDQEKHKVIKMNNTGNA
jgi:hypothetical protein